MKKRKVKLFASIASLGLVVAVMGVGVWAATQQAVKVSSQVSFTATSVAADIKLSVNNAARYVAPQDGALTPEQEAENAKMVAGGEYDIVKKATLSHKYKDDDTNTTDIDESKHYEESKELVDILYSEKAIKGTTDTNTNITTYEYVDESGNHVDVENVADADDVDFGDDRKQARRIAYFTNDYAKTLYENRIFLELQDKDEDGYLNIGAKVVYEFTIQALSSSAPIYYHITSNLFDTKIFNPDPTPETPNPLPVRIQDAFEIQIFDKGTVGGSTELNAQQVKDSGEPISAEERTSQATDPADYPTATLTNWTEGYTGDTTDDKKAIQPGETRTIQVVYTVKDMDGTGEGKDLYQGISYTMKSLELGDIYIKLANNGNNIAELPNYVPGIDETAKNDKGEGFDKFVDWITGKEDKPEESDEGAGQDGE